MAKTITFNGSASDAALACAALKSKATIDGKEISIGGRENVALPPGGFERTIVLRLHVVGNIGKDYEKADFSGVSLNDVYDLMAVMMGCTERHARKAAEVLAEVMRAKRDKRDIQPVTITYADGSSETLVPDAMLAEVEKLADYRKRIAAVAKEDRFSTIIKEMNHHAGPITFSTIETEALAFDAEAQAKVA